VAIRIQEEGFDPAVPTLVWCIRMAEKEGKGKTLVNQLEFYRRKAYVYRTDKPNQR